MEHYLSIGEVAKARNVNVQSLRYYEKLGILIPAYINPDNGYRYYTLEQIMILDTIILCVDLGIPLKSLKQYVDGSGQLAFERLLEDGRRLAQEKIQKIEENLQAVDRTLQHVQAQKVFQGRQGYYTRSIFRRCVVTRECEQVPDARNYEKYLNSLFEMARERGLHASFPHGIVSRYEGREYCGSRMFLEVLPGRGVKTESFPAGDYLCFQEKREIHSDPAVIFAGQLDPADRTEVIVSSMSPTSYKYDHVVLEFQVLAPAQP